jgi:hypothetical protein
VQTRRHFASDVAVGVLAGYLGGGSLGLIHPAQGGPNRFVHGSSTL